MRRRRLRRTPAGSFNILPCALQGRAFRSCSSRDGCTCLNLAVHHNARWGELLMSQPCFSDACAAAFPCLFGILPAAATDAPHALCVAQFAGQLCCIRLLRRRTVGQLPGRVVCVTPSDRKRSREQVLPLRDLLRPTARRAAERRADGRRRRLVARSTARRAWRRAGGPRGRAAAACVRRWRGARPQTRRRSVAEPRAPRRPSCARASGCARAVCVSPVCVISYARLWPVAVGRIDVLRRPNDHRASSLHPVAVYMLERINFDRWPRTRTHIL